MQIENIVENIIDKHMYNQWQKYDLRLFIESVVMDTLVLKDIKDSFRFKHGTNWKDRNRYRRD